MKTQLATSQINLGSSDLANWSYGQFPSGRGNFPVSHISWFEARAYANYKGRKLPNLFQWLYSAKLSGLGLDSIT